MISTLPTLWYVDSNNFNNMFFFDKLYLLTDQSMEKKFKKKYKRVKERK